MRFRNEKAKKLVPSSLELREALSPLPDQRATANEASRLAWLGVQLIRFRRAARSFSQSPCLAEALGESSAGFERVFDVRCCVAQARFLLLSRS